MLKRVSGIRFWFYLLFLVLLQEIFFRWVYPVPELKNFDRINYMVLGEDRGYRAFLRNQNWYWESSPDSSGHMIHYMNQYGFRDHEWEVNKSGKPRVLFIGDSFTEGVMATQSSSIPAWFQEISGQDLEVFNGGMMGVGISSYLQLLSDMVPVFKPDVVIMIFFANDHSHTPPQIPAYEMEPQYYSWCKPRLLEIVQLASEGRPLNPRWKNKPMPYLPSVPARNNPWTTDRLTLSQHVRDDIAVAMQKGEFNPFRTNQLLKEREMVGHDPMLDEAFDFLAYFRQKHDFDLITAYIPARHHVTNKYYPFEKAQCITCPETLDFTLDSLHTLKNSISAITGEKGIPFIDLTPIVRQAEQQGNELYWHYDDHMLTGGYQLVSRTLWEYSRDRLSE